MTNLALPDKQIKGIIGNSPLNLGTLAEMAADALLLTPADEGKRWQATDDSDRTYAHRFAGGAWGYYAEGGTNENGDINTTLGTSQANERNIGTLNQFGIGVDECNYHAWATATGDEAVSVAPALVFGVLVTGGVTGTISIEDGIDDTGVVVLTVPTSAAVGTFFELKGAKFNTGIFIDDNSSAGSLTVLWRPQ